MDPIYVISPDDEAEEGVGYKKVYTNVPESGIFSDDTKWDHKIAKLKILGPTDENREGVIDKKHAHFRTSKAKIVDIYSPFNKNKEEKCFIRQLNSWFGVGDIIEDEFDEDTVSANILDTSKLEPYKMGIRYHRTEAAAIYYFLFISQYFYKLVMANDVIFGFEENRGHIDFMYRMISAKDKHGYNYFCSTHYSIYNNIDHNIESKNVWYKDNDTTYNCNSNADGLSIDYDLKDSVVCVSRYNNGHKMSDFKIDYKNGFLEDFETNVY